MNLQIQPLYQRTGNVGLRLKKYPDQLKKHFGVSLKVKRRNLSGINLKNAVSNPVSLLWAPQAPLQGNSPSQGQLDWQKDIRTEDTEQPSCSTLKTASINQISSKPASAFPPGSKMAQSDMEEWSSAAKLDGAAVGLLPHGADRRGGVWPSVGGGDEGAPLSSTEC